MPIPSPFAGLSDARLSLAGIDPTGGRVVQTADGPAVLCLVGDMTPGQLARHCARLCVRRMGAEASAAHVMREAERLGGAGVEWFCKRTAERELKKVVAFDVNYPIKTSKGTASFR